MKISIITPVFNSKHTIEKTIKSVLSQKTSDVEYIIVDGKSTDGTLDVINQYINKIDLVISEKDKGISDAYNKGIVRASGDLIGIVAADDQLIGGSIETIQREYDGISDVFSGHVIEYDGCRYIKRKSSNNLELLRLMTSIEHPATFIRKEAYERYGNYSLDYKCAIDRELLLRFYISGAKFQIVDHFFSFMLGGGISTNDPTKYAFPEDRIISEKYGMSKVVAELQFEKACRRYRKQKCIKYVLNLFHIRWMMHSYMKAKGHYLTNKEIIELKKVTF